MQKQRGGLGITLEGLAYFYSIGEIAMQFRTLTISAAVALCHFGTVAHAADELPSPLQFRDFGPGMLEDVREALPESRAVDASFLDPAYNPNLRFSQDGQVAISFIDEGAGYRNSLGYFTFEDNSFDGLTFSDIDLNGSGNIDFNEINAVDGVEAEYMFANFSERGGGGKLSYGDSYVIGGGLLSEEENGDVLLADGKVFETGQNLGFFVSANAWAGNGIKGLDRSGAPPNYFSVDFLNPEAGANANFYETPDISRHTAMMFHDTGQDDIMVGFEDLNRLGNSDEDFNDAIFIVRSDPFEALADNSLDIATAPSPALGLGGGLVVAGAFFRRRKKKS